MSITLAPALKSIIEQPYPRFSRQEMERRRGALAAAMDSRGVDHLVFYGAGWRGSIVHWLTQWSVTTEAAGVFTPGARDKMFVHYYNHLQLARKLATECDVEWAGESAIKYVADELKRRGAKPGRVGLIGSLGHDGFTILKDALSDIKVMGRDYVRLRKVKSAEELNWFRIGAYLSDLGIEALAAHAKPGVTERELANEVERAYVGLGGGTGIHFIGATPMGNPSVAAPCQYHSSRRIEKGDVVFSEISAHLYDYSGQVLRSFTVGEEPNALYRDLYAAADKAYDAMIAVLRAGATPMEVIKASGVIEEAGFTTIDDILHGYGGGYFPPVLGSQSRSNSTIPEEPFEAGQLVVVQPNVVTKDHRAGVQTGEMLRVTDTGVERMHQVARGFRRV